MTFDEWYAENKKKCVDLVWTDHIARFAWQAALLANPSGKQESIYEQIAKANDEFHRPLPSSSHKEAKPVAWVRYRSDGGFEGPIMDSDSRMCDTRRSFWTPLYAAARPASKEGD